MTTRTRLLLTPGLVAIGLATAAWLVIIGDTAVRASALLAAVVLTAAGVRVMRGAPVATATPADAQGASVGARHAVPLQPQPPAADADAAARATLAHLPEPVLIFGVGGVLTFANAPARAAFAVGAPLAPGEAPTAAALSAALEPVLAFVFAGRGALTPRTFDEALTIPGADGPRRFLPRAAPLYGPSGAIEGVVVLLLDVTRLAHAGQLADDLVATVAHELRTPLTSLHMAIHLCLEGLAGGLSEKQTELLLAAREDCERIRSLVDEILDLARLQSGRTPLERTRLRLGPLLTSVAEAHRAAAERRGVTLSVEALPDCPDVLADPERVQLALANLVANAIRHTPRGGHVSVACSASGDAARLEVKDDGEGIAPEHQARLFDRFYQIPGRERGGAGLGLTLAREIVTAHGGTIGVESTPGHGSRFFFTLPGA